MFLIGHNRQTAANRGVKSSTIADIKTSPILKGSDERHGPHIARVAEGAVNINAHVLFDVALDGRGVGLLNVFGTIGDSAQLPLRFTQLIEVLVRTVHAVTTIPAVLEVVQQSRLVVLNEDRHTIEDARHQHFLEENLCRLRAGHILQEKLVRRSIVHVELGHSVQSTIRTTTTHSTTNVV